MVSPLRAKKASISRLLGDFLGDFRGGPFEVAHLLLLLLLLRFGRTQLPPRKHGLRVLEPGCGRGVRGLVLQPRGLAGIGNGRFPRTLLLQRPDFVFPNALRVQVLGGERARVQYGRGRGCGLSAVRGNGQAPGPTDHVSFFGHSGQPSK